ncbi:hypothetical protein [Adhaeretor mobilis]|uniref:Uncharacterized protein n=1 Tax=Adhaeretor mobilis TaxID=1930276 RepID=A0A517MV95_9BACT|nr:hypothetical protein [Adhaeretor mobilis]QDS98798.1 hypothetical protein HG15A2_20830 [Adhaeretor mobilis]
MSNQQPQMSRRDWFRLRKPVAPPKPHTKLGDQPQIPLAAAEEPVNHGGVDLSALPPMHEALLNAGEVTSLFSDLAQHATAVQLITRRGAGVTPDQSEKLAAARDQLLDGTVRKLQVRYQWDSSRWIDTLERRPDGFRLVRIQHV